MIVLEVALLVLAAGCLFGAWLARPPQCRGGHVWQWYAPQPDYEKCDRCPAIRRRRGCD